MTPPLLNVYNPGWIGNLGVPPAPPAPVSLDYIYAEVTVNHITNSETFVDIPGALLPSADFVAGGKYLLLFSGGFWNTDGGGVVTHFIRAVHGTPGTGTEFEGSEFRTEFISGSEKRVYAWSTVWTAVAGDEIRLQHHTSSFSTNDGIDSISMVAIRLDLALTEGVDWNFAERLTNDSLNTTFTTTNPSITIQSGDHEVNDLHLILANSLIDSNLSTQFMESRLERTGEATENRPFITGSPNRNTENHIHQMIIAHQLGASDNTFETASRVSTSTGTRLYSNVFSLNLSRFLVSGFSYDETEIALTTTAFATLVRTLTMNLSSQLETKPVCIISFAVADFNGGTQYVNRLQVDNVTEPEGSDHTIGMEFQAATSEIGRTNMTTIPLGPASHTFDVDASEDLADVAAEDRLLVAFTLNNADGAFTFGTINKEISSNLQA